MPFKSRAQQGFMHAAAARGDVPQKVVRKFDESTTARQFARLPERAAEGGLAGRLAAKRYARGGPVSHEEDPHGGVCQHFFHGGVAEEHSPECYDHPDNPMFRGDAEETPPVVSNYAEGGEAKDPSLIDSLRDWFRARPGQESQEAGKQVDEAANAALPEGLSARDAILKKRQQLKDLDEQTKDYADGGEVEGARSPLAERLAGARNRPPALSRILRKPGNRTP